MAVSETGVVTAITVLYVVAMLVALVGNIVLIYIVWTKPDVRSLTSSMFVNMAVADLMVTLFMMPVSIAQLHTNFTWAIPGVLGEITCRSFGLISHATVMASILCLAFMAIDRFYAVVYPWKHRCLVFRKTKFVTPLIWIMSFALMAIMAVVYYVYDPTSQCGIDIFGNQTRTVRGLFLYLFAISYFIPLVIISVLYAKTAHKVWFRRAPSEHLSINQQQQREITKRRVVRMLIIIVIVFALCWLPGQVIHLYWAITAWHGDDVPGIVTSLAFWLGHANSAINPWLYIFLSSKIYSAFTKMIHRQPNGQSQQSTETMTLTRATAGELHEVLESTV